MEGRVVAMVAYSDLMGRSKSMMPFLAFFYCLSAVLQFVVIQSRMEGRSSSRVGDKPMR